MCDRNLGGVNSTNLKIKINKQTISDSKRVFLYILINFDLTKLFKQVIETLRCDFSNFRVETLKCDF